MKNKKYSTVRIILKSIILKSIILKLIIQIIEIAHCPGLIQTLQ